MGPSVKGSLNCTLIGESGNCWQFRRSLSLRIDSTTNDSGTYWHLTTLIGKLSLSITVTFARPIASHSLLLGSLQIPKISVFTVIAFSDAVNTIKSYIPCLSVIRQSSSSDETGIRLTVNSTVFGSIWRTCSSSLQNGLFNIRL